MNDQLTVPCVPKLDVVNTRPGDRAIGRAVKANLPFAPTDQAVSDLVGDCFMASYQATPKLTDSPPIERSVNHSLLDWAMQSPNWSSGHATTTGNIPASLITAPLMWAGLTTDDALRDALDKQQQAEQAKQDERNAIDDMVRAIATGNEEHAKAALQQADIAKAMADQLAQQAQQSIENLRSNPLAQGMVNNAVKTANEAGEKVSALCKGWGIDPGTTSLQDAEQIVKLAQQNQGKFIELARLIGRLQGAALATFQTTRTSNTGPIADIDLTQDVSRVLPVELAKLSPSMPAIIRYPQIARFLSDGLPGWKSTEQQDRQGNLVCEVDGSGSFVDSYPTAAAIALALGKACIEDTESPVKRKYQLATFGSKTDKITSVADDSSWQDHITWASYCPAGGTDFDTAFADAIVRLTALGKTNTDLVFITDGYARLSADTLQAWQKFVKDCGARLHYISVDAFYNNQIKGLCTTYVELSSSDLVNNPDKIVTILAGNMAIADLI